MCTITIRALTTECFPDWSIERYELSDRLLTTTSKKLSLPLITVTMLKALYTLLPGRPVQSNNISTFLGSILPRCNQKVPLPLYVSYLCTYVRGKRVLPMHATSHCHNR